MASLRGLMSLLLAVSSLALGACNESHDLTDASPPFDASGPVDASPPFDASRPFNPCADGGPDCCGFAGTQCCDVGLQPTCHPGLECSEPTGTHFGHCRVPRDASVPLDANDDAG